MTSTSEFTLTELDLLATYAGRRPPFPLRVPSCGRDSGERAALLAEAGRTLSERGLANEDGPVRLAADFVDTLRDHRRSVDLVVVCGSLVRGTVAMIDGEQALLCGQSIGGEPGPVTVTRITDAALTAELSGRIPRAAAAQAMPITLPPGVVEAAARLEGPAPRKRLRALVAERGGDEAAVDALIALLPSVTGRGQGGVVVDGVGRTVELSWLDSPHGRVRVDRDESGWVSVNPLRRDDLVKALRDAAAG
ncbi:ESX secretion-associated protein EspG [Amycolatopsis suaedae]|uniref:ESX secretion-associated protein EspG n=1 Tax=Amycolatopsis suaedae TaxID=2510978 RepID=A0A4Q7J6E2_9PSEU|nr:ESX secretion-associated protein EspG [Amycolatopsis suaedae]RZQ62396.1 ESX secretion-associated protein EspG [Amycolatopsis suaedae]